MLYVGSTEKRRERRTRLRLKERAFGKPRLSVFRSGKYIYAQIIDDEQHCTVVSAASIEKEGRAVLSSGGNLQAACWVGKRIAEKALKKGVSSVVFDRGKYLYHGRVKALAEAAREGGLVF